MGHKQLARSDKNKVIAGVCGGISEYLDIDANIVRLVFFILIFIQPLFALLYLILVLLLPRPEAEDGAIGERTWSNATEFEKGIENLKDVHQDELWLGIGLTVLGLILLLNNLGLILFDWKWVGAATLITIGVYLLLTGEG